MFDTFNRSSILLVKHLKSLLHALQIKSTIMYKLAVIFTNTIMMLSYDEADAYDDCRIQCLCDELPNLSTSTALKVEFLKLFWSEKCR